MRIKVELHPDVVRFIRRDCTETERDAFYEMLERLKQQPLKNSEFIHDPRLSRRMLRFARFAMYLVVFQYDIARQRIRVRICRKVPSGRRQDAQASDAGAKPPPAPE